MPTPIVLLHPRRPTALWRALRALGPCHYVAGSPSDTASLGAARASKARALAYLAHSSRPSKVGSSLLECCGCLRSMPQMTSPEWQRKHLLGI